MTTDNPRTEMLTPAGAPAALSRRRVPLASYALVALVALVVGSGGTLIGLRARFAPEATGVTTPLNAAGAAPDTHEMTADPGGAPAGSQPTAATGTIVYISPARQQLIGVRTDEVATRTLETTIRTIGTLAYDETRIAQIHTKVAGWIERVYVDYIGKRVRQGEPLFAVYSPDLVSTQNEYVLALEAERRLSDSQFAETRRGAASLVAATRQRLTLWDITDAQIDELARTREPQRTMTLYSPFTGIVLERNAFAGQYVMPEMMTFKIADLATVWVLGQIFEYELPMVKLGQEAWIEFPYVPSARVLKGHITYIYPDVDPMTRRVKVRVEFPNPGLELKPDSYVTVVLRASGGESLAVPQEAVIDTGVMQYALVAHPNGYFEPREIAVGPPVDRFYPVLRGLEAGDRVVTSAQFLVDSETNLQAALQSMAGHGDMGANTREEADRPAETPGRGREDHAGH